MSNSRRWAEFITWWDKYSETAWHPNPPEKCVICNVNKKIDSIKRRWGKKEGV